MFVSSTNSTEIWNIIKCLKCNKTLGCDGINTRVFQAVAEILLTVHSVVLPRSGSGVERIDPFRFLVGCRKKATKLGSVCLISYIYFSVLSFISPLFHVSCALRACKTRVVVSCV